MVMNGESANGAWRSSTDMVNTATVVSYEDSQLLFQFLTPHASDMRGPRNVVPYYEIPVYKLAGFLFSFKTITGRKAGTIFQNQITKTTFWSTWSNSTRKPKEPNPQFHRISENVIENQKPNS